MCLPLHIIHESIAQLRKGQGTDEENMFATLQSQDICSGCSLIVVFNSAVHQADACGQFDKLSCLLCIVLQDIMPRLIKN